MDNIHESPPIHLLKNETTAGFDFETYIRSISAQNDPSSYPSRIDMPHVYRVCCCLIFAIFFLTITIGIAFVGYRQLVTKRKPSKIILPNAQPVEIIILIDPPDQSGQSS